MAEDRVDEQKHGYRSGHQLLAASIKLSREDQDTVDRLSDMAGPLQPGETFSPYLTSYPLPGGTHYVLARTWQDLAAPRAGCVLTRSLFVPMPMWERLDNLTSLLPHLLTPQPNAPVRPVNLNFERATLPTIEEPRVVQLIEALFLETRQPIVFFDTPEAENISLRLLTALWPGLRRNFSLCTFALAPRKIAGRDFDLLFAPKAARSRFSDWVGRRIEVGVAPASRHRWSSITASQIFEAENPSLIANDALGLLKGDGRADEATLRLSLLWSELSEKASSSPTAVLGLLDILNSQHERISGAPATLVPLVLRSIMIARDQFRPQQAWRFFSALAAKFPNESIPAEVLEAMRHAAVTLAARDPTTAFLFLAQEGREQRRVPLQLLDGVATGLAESETELLEGLTTLVPDLAIALISEKPTLARRLVVEVKRSPAPSILSVGNILSSATDEMREPARSSLAPYLDSDSLAPLLTPLLSGATGQEVVDFAVNIGRGSDFAAAAFDKPIKDAAQSQGSLLKLRNAVAREFHSANSNRFITSTLHPNRDEVTWICDSLTEDRARNVLLRLLQTTPEYSFHDVVHDPALGGRVLDILARDLPSEAAVVATLLTQANVSIDRLLEIGERALPFLQTNDKHKLVIHLVSRALSEAAISDTRVSSLIEQVGTDTPATNLIALATKENASSSRIAENILILERASPSTRMSIVTHIDHLSGRLANTRLGNLGQAAYEAWAKMIVDTPNKEVQFNAASLALNYALQRKEFPVTSLIIAAFPIVYVELLRSKEGDELSIPAFLMLPLSFFVDWDRARSAREGLVEAFMNSNWPPADLVLTVSEVNLEKWVFEHLSRSRMGRNYVARIEADLPRLDTPQQRRIRKNVDQLFS